MANPAGPTWTPFDGIRRSCPRRSVRTAPPARTCRATRAGPPPVGPVRSTPEITIPFFPKWRSVGPEPGRTLFFRIVRTGPPGGGPARSFLPDPLSTSLTHPGSIRDRRLVLTVAGLYKTGSCVHVQPLRDHLGSSFDPRDTPARAGHEPDASPRNTLTRATSNASGRGQQEAPPPFPAAPAPGRAARSSFPPRLHLTVTPPSLSADGLSLRCRTCFACRTVRAAVRPGPGPGPALLPGPSTPAVAPPHQVCPA